MEDITQANNIVTIDNEASTQYTAFKCGNCPAEWSTRKLPPPAHRAISQCMVCKTSFMGIRYGEIAYYRRFV